MKWLLLAESWENWADHAVFFEEKGITLLFAHRKDDVGSLLRNTPPALVLLDASALTLEDIRSAIIALLMANAMVHVAVVSSIPEQEFHDATEGLGILMQISKEALGSQVDRLLAALHAVNATFTKKSV